MTAGAAERFRNKIAMIARPMLRNGEKMFLFIVLCLKIIYLKADFSA
jgi:hypothetical protein